MLNRGVVVDTCDADGSTPIKLDWRRKRGSIACPPGWQPAMSGCIVVGIADQA